MNCYTCLNHPKSFVLDALCTTYHCTSYLDQIFDFSPSVYWNINPFKFDTNCYKISEGFADDDPLSWFYDFFDDVLPHIDIYPGNERKPTSVEEISPGGDDKFFDFMSSSF